MKTTSYEISKKLEEAGFIALAEKCWAKTRSSKSQESILIPLNFETLEYFEERYPSYDLETLLNALPDSITREYKSKEDGEVREFKERLIIEKEEIRYSCDDIENADDANRYYQEYGYMQDISLFKKFNDNSLADTAGKMWLLLKEKGII